MPVEAPTVTRGHTIDPRGATDLGQQRSFSCARSLALFAVRPRWHGAPLEIVALLAIILLGFAFRADGLMLLPRLTDETEEVRIGLQVARGEPPALVGVKPYIGNLFTLLVALAFRLIGPNIEVGRLVVLVAGTLTMVPTYLLGRELGGAGSGPVARGRMVGMLAALLLAVSGPHIMTVSRIAYSNSLTPLFTTTALWLLCRALVRRSSSSLVASGLVFGLAVQTHVSALSLVPGLVAAVRAAAQPGYQDTGIGRRRWPGPALLMATAGVALFMVANLVVFNLEHRLASVDAAGERVEQYVGDDPWTLIAWCERLVAIVRAVALAIAGQVSEAAWPLERLGSPFVVLPVLLALLGLWAFGRRRAWLPLTVALSVMLCVSILNGRVEALVPRVRHYATLLPLGAVLIAEGVAALRELLRRRWHATWISPAFVATATLVLVTGPLSALRDYQSDRLARPEKNNAAYLDVLRGIAESGSLEDRVYLDDELADVRTFSGGQMLQHLQYGLLVVGQEVQVIDVEDDRLPIGRHGTQSKRLIIAADDLEPAAARYHLEPLPGDPGDGAALRAFRAFPRDISDERSALAGP